MSRLDVVSLVAGVVLSGLGVLLLLDQAATVDLGFGWLTPAVLAAVGAILVAFGRDRGRRRG